MHFVVKVAFWTSGFLLPKLDTDPSAFSRHWPAPLNLSGHDTTDPGTGRTQSRGRLGGQSPQLSWSRVSGCEWNEQRGKRCRVGWCHLDQFPSVDWRNVITSMGILCLVNCFNLHIRKASWNLLSTTVSIFSAASFDFSIYRLIQLPFGTSEHNMESQWGFEIALGLWCLAVFAIVHTMLLNCDQRYCLEAGTTLGSHIYAFASILVFGNMQKWHCTQNSDFIWKLDPEIIWVWLVPVLAFCVMVILSFLMFIAFRQCHRNKMK